MNRKAGFIFGRTKSAAHLIAHQLLGVSIAQGIAPRPVMPATPRLEGDCFVEQDEGSGPGRFSRA